MTSFNGISQQKIYDSIVAAAEFVRSLNVGPACDKLVAPLLREENLAAILEARTEEGLRFAINESGARESFVSLNQLLLYHAHANTEGKGFSVYHHLAEWGAVFGARDEMSHDHDAEIRDHLSKLPPRDLRAPLPGGDPAFYEYGVVFPNQPEDSRLTYSEMEERWGHLMAQVGNFLKPYNNGVELRNFGYGAVGSFEGNQLGVSFRSTPDFAQKVADAFPDLKVVDDKDHVVAPNGKYASQVRASQEQAAIAATSRGI